MILLLDTSTPICKLSLIDDGWRYDDEWRADRELAKKLLAYLRDQLNAQGKSWKNITGIGAFQGPGSFTGLRIGLSVLNTIAESQSVPIVGVTGENWQNDALRRLDEGQNDRLVLPFYGSEAHITKPRK
jgi:tRNA threonylcarbamoyladenosine biosynthesis protein TsaB